MAVDCCRVSKKLRVPSLIVLFVWKLLGSTAECFSWAFYMKKYIINSNKYIDTHTYVYIHILFMMSIYLSIYLSIYIIVGRGILLPCNSYPPFFQIFSYIIPSSRPCFALLPQLIVWSRPNVLIYLMIYSS